jgi:hypothetical protein
MTAIDIRSQTVEAIYAAYVAKRDEKERNYLGASIIGDPCHRKLFYSFRWVSPPEQFDGRMLRLFETGHREEARMIADLRMSGVEVWDVDENGEQFGFKDLKNHWAGHMDGVLMGVKEAPKTPHLFEAKTHNLKSFKKLLSEGVASKPLHVAQMQVYMHYEGLTRAPYLAHCKDNDELYVERLEYDPIFAMRLIAKAAEIITADAPPMRLHDDPSKKMAFECGWCQHKPVCHDGAWPRRNCRTCISSTPDTVNGGWTCDFHIIDLTYDQQQEGCSSHRYLPGLVNGVQYDSDSRKRTISYGLDDGTSWTDGGDDD